MVVSKPEFALSSASSELCDFKWVSVPQFLCLCRSVELTPFTHLSLSKVLVSFLGLQPYLGRAGQAN